MHKYLSFIHAINIITLIIFPYSLYEISEGTYPNKNNDSLVWGMGSGKVLKMPVIKPSSQRSKWQESFKLWQETYKTITHTGTSRFLVKSGGSRWLPIPDSWEQQPPEETLKEELLVGACCVRKRETEVGCKSIHHYRLDSTAQGSAVFKDQSTHRPPHSHPPH